MTQPIIEIEYRISASPSVSPHLSIPTQPPLTPSSPCSSAPPGGGGGGGGGYHYISPDLGISLCLTTPLHPHPTSSPLPFTLLYCISWRGGRCGSGTASVSTAGDTGFAPRSSRPIIPVAQSSVNTARVATLQASGLTGYVATLITSGLTGYVATLMAYGLRGSVAILMVSGLTGYVATLINVWSYRIRGYPYNVWSYRIRGYPYNVWSYRIRGYPYSVWP